MAVKKTISFPVDLHEKLAALATRRASSFGELVVDACRQQYFGYIREDRLAAVAEMARLSLPVGSPEEMERESVCSVGPCL